MLDISVLNYNYGKIWIVDIDYILFESWVHLIAFRSIIILERSIMFNEPNLELVVLCVTLLIETSIRPDLTEMLRPYSQTCKVILFYT